MRRFACASVVLILAGIAGAGAPVAQVLDAVSLKISQEVIPPGGIAQMKVFVTEPKPISTGGGRFDFDDFQSFDGIAINSPADDTYGVARVDGTIVSVTVESRTSSFGTGSSDYPILTVAGRIPASAPLGSRLAATIDTGALRLMDPSGALYPAELKNGFVQVARGLSIDDVSPGSAVVPEGGVVTILGTGFVPGTEIKFNGVRLGSTRYVSPQRIEVVLAGAARMHGMRVRAKNPDGAKVAYFAYQRTEPIERSSVPAFTGLVPLFPGASSATIAIGVPDATDAGLALQNIGSEAAVVSAGLESADGRPLGAVGVLLPAHRYLVRELIELFQMPVPAGGTIRLTATSPIQAMAVAVDAAGTPRPVLPR